jgi:polynucleotide 5'-hydroxyl-kinase GRC3/NOL9
MRRQECFAPQGNVSPRSGVVSILDESGPWAAAIERVLERKGTVMLLGAPDTGKTTLARDLVNAAVARDLGRVALLDADVGQGEIGPPGTVALATVRAPVEALAELKAERLSFVGATSPPGHLLAVVTGVRRLADEAQRRDAALIVVDTSGLVQGAVARSLKQAKVDLLRPETVLALQAGTELEGVLRLIETASEATVLRLPPYPGARPKPPGLRRARRSARFYHRFERARTFEIPSAQVAISHGWLFNGRSLPPHRLRAVEALLHNELIHAEESEDAVHLLVRRQPPASAAEVLREEVPGRRAVVTPAYMLQNLLVGLVEQDGNLADIGILQGVDFHRRVLTVLTPLNHVGNIHQVRLGRLRLRADGSEIGPVRPGDL